MAYNWYGWRRGGFGMGYARGLGLGLRPGYGIGRGLGPNLSPYCRWFPWLPRWWWAHPSMSYQQNYMGYPYYRNPYYQ